MESAATLQKGYLVLSSSPYPQLPCTAAAQSPRVRGVPCAVQLPCCTPLLLSSWLLTAALALNVRMQQGISGQASESKHRLAMPVGFTLCLSC